MRRSGVLAVAIAAVSTLPGRAQEPATTAAGPPPADTLTLREALAAARARHPDLRAARAAVSAERAARRSDWGAFLPEAGVVATFGRSDFTTFSFALPEGTAAVREDPVRGERLAAAQSLRFGWTLLEGGRRFAELAAGAEDLRAAELRLRATRRRVAAAVEEAYLEAIACRRLVTIASRELRRRRQGLGRALRRFRVAAVDRADVLAARARVWDAEVELLEAREADRRARWDLAVRMDAPDRLHRRTVLAPPAPPPDPGSLRPESVVVGALADHPELRALGAAVAAASDRARAERSAYLPTVSLTFEVSRSESLGPGGEFFNFDPRNRSKGLTLAVGWRLFGGFSRHERIARRDADVDRRRARRARRRLEIERIVRNLVAEARLRKRRLELRERRLELSRERLRLTEGRYRIGSADYAELQRVLREVVAVERATVRERCEYRKAWARLRRWVGAIGGDT